MKKRTRRHLERRSARIGEDRAAGLQANQEHLFSGRLKRLAATIAALGGTELNPETPLAESLASAVVPWRQRKAEAEEKRRLRKQRRNGK